VEEPLLSTIEYTWGYADRNTYSIAVSFGAECHEVEMAVEKLKRHKSPGTDQLPAELMKVGGRTIHAQIHKLTNSIWNKEELPEQWQ
jgi:hypothetical protein